MKLPQSAQPTGDPTIPATAPREARQGSVRSRAIKRIPVNRLLPGMYLHEVCGSWMDHPFWRSSFALTKADIGKIAESGIAEAWIDTSKGLDVVGGVSQDEARVQVERELVDAATSPMPLLNLPEPKGSEWKNAAAVCERSKKAVTRIFDDVRLGRAIDPALCLPVVQEISESVLRDPSALISLSRLKARNEYTYMHSVAVCGLMVALSRQLGFTPAQVRQAGLAGMLHDVGKALTPLEILNKPGKLSDEEFTIMRSHSVLGHALLLEGGAVDAMALDVALHHHEKIDGSGYPDALEADQISIFARMGTVCDVYDAVTSDRPYKAGWDPGEALREMAQWKGHFDPLVFQAFVKTVGIYPIGSLVRMQSGHLAVVTLQGQGNLLLPKVKVFYDIACRQHIPPFEIDLASAGGKHKIASVESPSQWKLSKLERLWLPPR
jgi:putative nucleotidyltransferase with HDIG domain